jgi:hypothetical protein
MEVAMLEGKTRIPPVDIETLPEDVREVLEEQRKRWGAPLYPQPGVLPCRACDVDRPPTRDKTRARCAPGLLNRRVASWNNCEF